MTIGHLKTSVLAAGVFLGAFSLAQADVALVYENSDAVLKGQSTLGTVTPEGILTSAELALKANTKPLLATAGEKLHYGVLIRLDNELNAALFKLGDEVKNDALQKAHEKRAQSLLAFLPMGGSPESLPTRGLTIDGKVVVSTDPFIVKINGQSISEGPVVIKTKSGRADATVEVFRNSTDPIWKITMKLQSDPKVLFWNKGKRPTMNDVPRSKFSYDHQLLFSPLHAGSSVKLPLEISSIKNESSVWTLVIESKNDSMQTQIPITFQKG